VSPRKPTRAKQLGVTDDEYGLLLESQEGRCALCPNEPKTRRLHVDHDHRTGAVRGLLCFRCNRAVAYWMNEGWALRLSRYLRQA
jgi:Recombination endonuclease VII